MPLKRALTSLTASISLALVACGDGAEDQARGDVSEEAVVQAETKWGYEGAGSPENWGKLSEEYATCESGDNQSPINLVGASLSQLPDPTFNYALRASEIKNLGHTLQVDVEPGSSMTLQGRQYELAQFHFHTPSEHRLQGTEYPAELHFVHKGPGNELAVVGVFIKEGPENQALSSFWDKLPRAKGGAQKIEAGRLTAESLLPQTKQHYLYPGSLTTPPCSEGVNWMVLNEPISMSSQQLSALKSVIGTSNRPVQPLGDRELKIDR